jgi:hypothetical protein
LHHLADGVAQAADIGECDPGAAVPPRIALGLRKLHSLLVTVTAGSTEAGEGVLNANVERLNAAVGDAHN